MLAYNEASCLSDITNSLGPSLTHRTDLSSYCTFVWDHSDYSWLNKLTVNVIFKDELFLFKYSCRKVVSVTNDCSRKKNSYLYCIAGLNFLTVISLFLVLELVWSS